MTKTKHEMYRGHMITEKAGFHWALGMNFISNKKAKDYIDKKVDAQDAAFAARNS